MQRYLPEAGRGLTEDEVAKRIAQGLVNRPTKKQTKSSAQIVKEHLFTLFNLINAILAIAVIFVGAYKNALFILLVAFNFAVGVVQEIRAKKKVETLSLLTDPQATVVRDGKRQEIALEEVVLDDVVEFSMGSVVCADCVVLEGSCYVDESALTGESVPVEKAKGDLLYSGSNLTSGRVYARAEKIADDCFAEKIASEGRRYKRPKSVLMKSFQWIIKTDVYIIIPLGVLLFLKYFFIMGEDLELSVTSTVSSMIGMLPEGLIVLVSLVFAMEVIRLAAKKTLVQQSSGIEMLARVDVLCMDKTGTLTEGNMKVTAIVPLEQVSQDEVVRLLAELCYVSVDNNSTMAALKGCVDVVPCEAKHIYPFSSDRKWSGAVFKDETIFLGAYSAFSQEKQTVTAKITELEEKGYRVLVLAKATAAASSPQNITPMGLLCLTDVLRNNAEEMLAFFKEQGVAIKILSGDSMAAVANLAKQAGLDGQAIDASKASPEELEEAAQSRAVFGRVSPVQKKIIVETLKKQGHTVGMVGDGVNDVPALRVADASIVCGSGSDAARCVAQMVILDSGLKPLYDIVMEGRRAINNLQRTGALFLVKTVFSMILSILFVFLPAVYPFEPIQLTLVSSLGVGIPSFLLAMGQDFRRVKGNFLANMLARALPGGLCVAINIVLLICVGGILRFSHEQVSTIATLITGYTTFLVLCTVAKPFNLRKAAMIVVLLGAFVACVLFFPAMFAIVPLAPLMVYALITMAAYTPFLFFAMQKITQTIVQFALRKIAAQNIKDVL